MATGKDNDDNQQPRQGGGADSDAGDESPSDLRDN